jgi:hypothetical protein
MDLHEIEIDIDLHGRVQLHVRGVPGEACVITTAALETALGGAVSRAMTEEAWETPSQVQRLWVEEG